MMMISEAHQQHMFSNLGGSWEVSHASPTPSGTAVTITANISSPLLSENW